MHCLIIDDEPAARDILQTYIGDTPGLKIKAVCKDALEAKAFLEEQSADLIFLDINMPRLSGISFIKTLKDPPKVILTTAYSEYALEGYELNVVDYLLKPFSFERFLKAVDKAKEQVQTANDDSLTVKADGKLFRISFKDIMFAESKGDYITIHTLQNKITFYQTLKSLADSLPAERFSRVHKSYLVSIDQIKYLDGNTIRIMDQNIPIGKSYKNDFLKKYTT